MEPIVHLPPAKMIAAIRGLPTLTVGEYVEEHFKGHLIRTSGTVNYLSDAFGSATVVLNVDDETGVHVYATFTKPLAPEVRLLSKGDKLEVVGTVFNVTESYVSLHDCQLARDEPDHQPAVHVVVVNNDKKWWETWWGILFLGIAVAVIGGLMVWAISRHYDKHSARPSALMERSAAKTYNKIPAYNKLIAEPH